MTEHTLGHYRLYAKLGEGGMGEVFRAFDTRLNRQVAIKIMRHQARERTNAVKRFLREARAASALNHPNIVTIHEIGETPDGSHYIVQELIEGQTLRTLLGSPLPPSVIVSVGAQVAKALGAAHAVGIVHRDVKPENIMVRGDGYAKVLDFGLARIVDEEDASSQATHLDLETLPGTILGTTSYMSPEQTRGGPVGSPTDIFALGVVLYEMACGHRPFVGRTPIDVVTGILSQHPVPLSRVEPSIPVPFEELVERMLDKAAEQRPSAGEVERVLGQAFQASRVVEAAPEPAPAVSAARTTVGRETQRAQLRRAYARAKEGRGGMVAVTGEPGIGKTSLIEDFLNEVTVGSDRPVLARGRCSERLAGTEAYLPVLEALDSLLRRGIRPSPDSMMKAVAPTWYMQLATGSKDSQPPDGEAAPAASQVRMKRELGALLQDLSRLQPVVVFLDDLHWADVSTIDLLNYLSTRLGEMRVLVVVSYRPSDMAVSRHPFLGIKSELVARGVFEEIGLEFLNPAEIEQYVALQFPSHSFPAGFAALLHEKTEGSPLFMADALRYLRDTGGVVEVRGSAGLARPLGELFGEWPESVRAMITRKIAQVDDIDRRLLVAASVQGVEFDTVTIAAAVEIELETVEERMAALETVHVFVRRGTERELQDRTITVEYRFVHVLYQNVLYATLQPTRRAQLSGRVARALIDWRRMPAPAQAGRLALLLEQARDFAESGRYFLLAAHHAASLFAFREALDLANRGLAAVRALPEDAARRQQELALQMVRALALRSVKGWAAPELEATFARARQLCQELGDVAELFPVMWNLAFFNMIRGDLGLVVEQTRTLRAQAEAAGQPSFLIAVDHIAGVTDEFRGDLVESTRLLEAARERHVPAQHASYTATFGIDPGMVARAMSSRPLWSLGYPDRAIERSHETIALCRSQRQPVTHVFALVVAEGIHLYRGETAEAMALGDEAIALCKEYEFPQEAEWAKAFQGAALTAQGRAQEGADTLKASLAELAALKSGLVRTTFLTLFADAAGRAGRIDEGLAAVDEGFAHAAKTMEHGFLGELHRVRGELFVRAGAFDRAEASLRESLADARARSARSFELRAATSLARLLAEQARLQEGRELLAAVYETFTEGFSTADLSNARELLTELRRPTDGEQRAEVSV